MRLPSGLKAFGGANAKATRGSIPAEQVGGALFPAAEVPLPLPTSVLCQRVHIADLGAGQSPD